MKAIGLVLVVLLLSGCAGLNPFGPGQELAVPTTLSQTGQEAAKLINGIKVGLIVANNTVAQQASEGLMLKSEAIAARKTIDDTWKRVKDAQALLGDGKDILAKGQAELIEKALAEFQRQLLARAAKKGT